MVASYDMDFVAIIRSKMHERAFREMIILSLPYLVQFLYNKVGVPKILGVSVRVKVTTVAHTSVIKDPTNSVIT